MDMESMFPAWDDEEATLDEVFQRVSEAEKIQKNAKDSLYYHVQETAAALIETGPEEIRELSFIPDRGLFALRGYPLDAIFSEQTFTVLYADTERTEYEIHMIFSFDNETQNISSICLLTRNRGTGHKDAWIDGKWTKIWNIHEDGPRDCEKCEDRMACEHFKAEKFESQQIKEAKAMATKIRKEFPGIAKALKKAGMNMLIVPEP